MNANQHTSDFEKLLFSPLYETPKYTKNATPSTASTASSKSILSVSPGSTEFPSAQFTNSTKRVSIYKNTSQRSQNRKLPWCGRLLDWEQQKEKSKTVCSLNCDSSTEWELQSFDMDTIIGDQPAPSGRELIRKLKYQELIIKQLNQKLSTQQEECGKKTESLERKLRKIYSKYDTMAQEYAEILSKYDDMSQRYSQLQSTHMNTSHELKMLTEKYALCKSSLDNLQTTYLETESIRNTENHFRTQERINMIDQVNSITDTHTQQITQLQQKLEKAYSQVKALISENSRLTISLEQREEVYNEAQYIIKNLENEVKKLQVEVLQLQQQAMRRGYSLKRDEVDQKSQRKV